MARLEKATRTYWRDSAIAGAIAGAVMLVYTGLSTGIAGAGMWLHPQALISPLGGAALPIPGYDAITATVGIALHLLSAAAWGLAYGAFLAILSTYGPQAMVRSWTVAVLMGLGWGVAVYALMGLLISPLVNPQAFLLNPVTYFVAHLIFGLVTALTLTSLSRRARAMRVTFLPEEAPVRTPTRR